MAQNPDFKPIYLPNLTLLYPRLKETFRYNAVEKKSEPCQPTVTNAAWSLSWEMPNDEAKKLFADLKTHYADCATRNKKLPEFSKVFGMAIDKEKGTTTFRAKKNGTSAAGKVNKPPTVIDHRKQPVDDLDFWSGTTANIRVIAFPATDPDGMGGISMLIDVVQVINPIYGGANLDEFGVVDQPQASNSLDEFSDPPARSAPPDTGSRTVPPPAKKAAASVDVDFG